MKIFCFNQRLLYIAIMNNTTEIREMSDAPTLILLALLLAIILSINELDINRRR